MRGLRLLGLVGIAETAALPALYGATSPDAKGGCRYGPNGFQYLAGAPAEQAVYSRLGGEDDAKRIWRISENLAHKTFPSTHPRPDYRASSANGEPA